MPMGRGSAPDHDAIDRALRRAHGRLRRVQVATGLPIVTGIEDRVVYRDPRTMAEIPEAELDAFIARVKRSWDSDP